MKLDSIPDDSVIDHIIAMYKDVSETDDTMGFSQGIQKGIIKAEQVLRALADSFAQEAVPGMPPACGEVALTFEPFISTAGNVYDFLDDLRESVAYWRRYVPEDGMRLSAVGAGLG